VHGIREQGYEHCKHKITSVLPYAAALVPNHREKMKKTAGKQGKSGQDFLTSIRFFAILKKKIKALEVYHEKIDR
jgi:hypothetical protein